MIGIVVVSHSVRLAEATVELALEMVHGPRPPIAIAAGVADGLVGTDAARVAEAIGEVATPAGTLVFMDLGSAVLSADLALELAGETSGEVRLSGAPFVEGILAAVVRAAGGGTLDEVAEEAAGALMAKRSQLGESETTQPAPLDLSAPTAAEVSRELTLVNRDGLHARPAAELVGAAAKFAAQVTVTNLTKRFGPASARSLTAITSLAARRGDTVRLEASGADADSAVQALSALIETGFGEPAGETVAAERGTVPESATAAPTAGASRRGHPLGVSAGRVAGPVALMAAAVAEPDAAERIDVEDRAAQAARIAAAAGGVADSLRTRADQVGGTAANVLRAMAGTAVDPELIDPARQGVLDRGLTPARAVWDAVGLVAGRYSSRGELLAARVVDLNDVRDRIIAELSGLEPPGVPRRDEPFVLAAVDLSPADTATLDAASCLAIITEQGGPTSHTAIIARSLGLPAVVAAAGVTAIPEGTVVLVDGSSGAIIIDPSDEELATLSRPEEVTATGGTGRTADGHPVALLANVAAPESVAAALEAQAEGIGLFRTEFCFLDRVEAPSIDEQVAAYRGVFDAFAGRKVTVRTLDAGSDKPLPFVTAPGEPNPALGARGYRTSVEHPEVLEDQLAAIAAAASASTADVWVMAPMVATPEEAADFAARCHRHQLSTVGVMVETPSAALMADEILAAVDFISLGTNDLAQYTMAADRTLGSVARMNDPWQPAVLRMVRIACQAAVAAGRPVGVCGEAAADPVLAPLLVGLGVTSLSMTPRALAAVRSALAGVTLERCRDLAVRACAAPTAEAARSVALGQGIR